MSSRFGGKSFAWVWALCLVVALLSLAAPTQQVTSSVTLSSPSFAVNNTNGQILTSTSQNIVGTLVVIGTGGTLQSFAPGPDVWASSGTTSASFAIAP